MPNSRSARQASVVVVLGTRPEAVKLISVIRALGERARLVHTGQHYDADLWQRVAGDLALPEPAHSIEVASPSRGEQIGAGVTGLTRLLLADPPAAVVVQGDTNSTLAGALAANATATPVVHVEAGLRSGDLTMPEESNRLLTDRISDLCCAPVPANADQLRAEGVRPERIAVTGNTLAETIPGLMPAPQVAAGIRAGHDLASAGYVLATVHRAGTVDDAGRLSLVLDALSDLARQAPVLLPLHPHTRARIAQFGLADRLAGVRVVPPMPPSEFLALEAGAALLVSDSGGVQEEAALLGVPLVVLRNSTERPELVGTWCRLVGSDPLRQVLREAWADAPDWHQRIAAAGPPYAHVGAGARIVRAMDQMLEGRRTGVRCC